MRGEMRGFDFGVGVWYSGGKEGPAPGRLHVWFDNRQQIKASGGYFLLFVLKVRKSGKNSIDYVGDASYHGNDNFHYHASPLQSNIPTGAGRVEETNRLEPSASIGLSIAWCVCLVKWEWGKRHWGRLGLN